MTERTVRICSLRVADGGARIVINIEISSEAGVEKQALSLLVARLGALPTVGLITEEELACYREESLFSDALARGYRYLGAADCSPLAMQKKLRAAGVADEQAREVVQHLIETGMLDARKSALREAEKCVSKLWGNRRILAALRAKGYDNECVSAVMLYLQGEDGVARCARLIEKRRMALPTCEPVSARFVATLVRYGYTGKEIKAAVWLLSAD